MKIPGFLFLLCGLAMSALAAQPFDAELAAYEKAKRDNLPKTALEILATIEKSALDSRDWGHALLAIARRIETRAELESDPPAESVRLVEAELSGASPEIKPLLHTLRAFYYWHFYQMNRHRFLGRTRTERPPGDDFTTWDLPRILARIHESFQEALADRKFLQKTAPVQFVPFFEMKSEVNARFRPTLFDVIAHEALAFYSSPEQNGALPGEALSASDPVFDEAFLAWQPMPEDSAMARAARLYQDLLRFHEKDEDRSAFAAADLDRIIWGGQSMVGEVAGECYRAALRRFSDEWKSDEISLLSQWHLAMSLREDAPAEARALMLKAVEAFPKSLFADQSRSLVKSIEAPTMQIHTGRVWSASDRGVTVNYRNLSRVHFRLVRRDWDDAQGEDRFSNPDQPSHKRMLGAWKSGDGIAWSADLEPTGDFRERTQNVAGPEKIAPGFYYLIASAREDFGNENNDVSITPVWVSDLALLLRTVENRVEGLVLEAESGEPVGNARVEMWYFTDTGKRLRGTEARTDEHGSFTITPEDGNRSLLLKASATIRGVAQSVAAMNQVHVGGKPQPERKENVVLFTDRALYRPGQMIHFKGIFTEMSTDRTEGRAVDARTVNMELLDANGRLVESARLKTNAFGSFSGSFTAPTGANTGPMTLRTAFGMVRVRVEEYKRPKFQVTLDKPTEAPRLNEQVKLKGMAENYTGAPVDGGKVAWRVTRLVRWPAWGFCRIVPPAALESAAVAHGTATTAADGTFEISFQALPDPKALEALNPVFTYAVHADVTDGAGETRSASENVEIGFTALRTRITSEEWQTTGKPVLLQISSTALDGITVADSAGTVKIHRLVPPDRVHRAPLENSPMNKPAEDLSDPRNWEPGEVVSTLPFQTKDGAASLEASLQRGAYLIVLETKDRFGKKVVSEELIRVLDPGAKNLGIRVPTMLTASQWQTEPGTDFVALWGTGYDTGRALVEIRQGSKRLRRFWTEPGRTQQEIRVPVTEAMRGGFTLQVTQMRENRAYLVSRQVVVPWSDKKLSLQWERFRSKLEPGIRETWTAVVKGPNAETATAEMVATLYDASLDQFLSHNWMTNFPTFRSERFQPRWDLQNQIKNPQRISRGFTGFGFSDRFEYSQWQFRSEFRHFAHYNRMMAGFSVGWAKGGNASFRGDRGSVAMPMSAPVAGAAPAMELEGRLFESSAGLASLSRDEDKNAPAPSLDTTSPRRNLQETAFFLPHLTSDADGTVRMEFTMPEALTTWRFLGFAHDTSLRAGVLTGETVTAKDLMVQPNPPRFLREGDALEFTVRVTNRSDSPQQGTARLHFTDADQSADTALGNTAPDQAFTIPGGESRTLSWRITVPDGTGFLTYKAVAATDTLSDGEEGWLPVLPRRILVTESMPLPIRGPGERVFQFQKLLDSGASDTLRHQALVVQMVSNPAWYAIMALPYLMEYPHECNEQRFNRFYANALAMQIAQSDPGIRKVFDQWRDTPALDSPLEKNQDLKSLLIEETPWLREAKSESQARRNVGILFDQKRLNAESARALRGLRENQLSDGSWAWFPGGDSSDFITLYITAGFARLRHLGNPVGGFDLALRALDRLDPWIAKRYEKIRERDHWQSHHPDAIEALYLYTRSFFLKDRPIPDASREAVDFFLGQTKKFGLEVSGMQTQAHLALAAHRFGDKETAHGLMRSIKERASNTGEMGMHWKQENQSWWWYRAPIETQALLIEAFDEVMDDRTAVEDCRVWLLKQKQTQRWPTTKSTADAVYALLLRGNDILSRDALVEVIVGGEPIRPEAVEAGTGAYEKRYAASEIKPEMGTVTMRKRDEGVAWGGVHWQYLEDVAKITPHEETPLQLKKQVFKCANTEKGRELQPVTGDLSVGDELVVRVELRVDRAMEFVHLKDQRGSGTEPVNVLSQHKFQDGLRYYESTRDTASHFFIENLPAGTYVFEYPVFIQHRGKYQTGIAEVQCMYAPEFNSHSGSVALEVR